MGYLYVHLVVAFLLILLSKVSGDGGRKLSNEELVKVALHLAEKTKDLTRSEKLQNAMSKVAGIYKDKTKVKSPRLQKTILLNVVESSSHKTDINQYEKYRNQLYNHLCFTKTLGLESVVHIVRDSDAQFENDVKGIHSIDPDIKVLEYPYELFWRNIANKKSPVKGQGGTVNYDGHLPTYKHFGFLVTLIPILEALLAGYNVIYFDVDIALVKDPLPYMLQGTADFIVSPEMRSCVYPSLQENLGKLDYNNLEANTGTMHIRSNKRTITMFQAWIDKIIEDNVNNDQKSLNFKKLNAKQTYDCNDHAQKFLPALTTVYKPDEPKFCFLNELLFQNGKLAFACAVDRFGSRSELMLAMAVMRYDGYGNSPPPGYHQSRYVVNDIPALQAEAAKDKYLTIAPATVHANFCDIKAHCLDAMNLWLVQDHLSHVPHSNTTVVNHSCKPYNVSATFFGKIDWQHELAVIDKEATEMAALPNNTVFRIEKRKRLFLLGDGAIHEFYDGSVFSNMGYKYEQVKQLKPFSYFMNYTSGRLLLDP